ncbi:MAG TPA: efflux RND transporter periplasmic adaptor subunit [Falsiroseomonas sp.]|jgi:RND family efflux transporter MFP subunit|nr:efflux RND transporter periplasmic adaptor subunit [Falsiroseomonas sp.]
MPDHPLPDTVLPRAAPTPEPDPAPAPRRRWPLAALLLAAAVGAGVVLREDIVAVLRPPAPPPAAATVAAPTPALTVAVAEARPALLARRIAGDGSVVAWQELVIGAEAGGLRVVEVAVQEGEAVREGQLLVRLEDALLTAQRDQAEAAVAEAEAALRIARQDLARAVELSRTQSAPRQTVEQREAAEAQAEARLAAARARRDEAAARLAQARILAPADGIVSRRTALLGAVTQPGQEMLRMIREGRVELDARVPELELAAVRPGQPVRVIHGERVIEAEVRAIAPTISPETRLGIVHVALPPDSGLRPGMFARAEIIPEPAPRLTVPQSALLFRDGSPAVLVLEGERVALRPVETGLRREGVVEITTGLRPSERVVVSGAGFLRDGDRVRVADPAIADRR